MSDSPYSITAVTRAAPRGSKMADISDEEFFKQRGFGLRIGYGGRPALIIIDMINAFTDKDMPLGAPLEDQIEAIEPLLEAAHERDLPVYFSTVAYEYVMKANSKNIFTTHRPRISF